MLTATIKLRKRTASSRCGQCAHIGNNKEVPPTLLTPIRDLACCTACSRTRAPNGHAARRDRGQAARNAFSSSQMTSSLPNPHGWSPDQALSRQQLQTAGGVSAAVLPLLKQHKLIIVGAIRRQGFVLGARPVMCRRSMGWWDAAHLRQRGCWPTLFESGPGRNTSGVDCLNPFEYS